MKKLVVVILLVLSILGLTAAPAIAASLSVSTSARVQAVGKVTFTVKTSVTSNITIAVLQNGAAVRTLKSVQASRSHSILWDQLNGAGQMLPGGTYSYTVTAVAGSTTRTVRGTVRVMTPPPVVATPTTPTAPPPPPPVVTPTSRWFGLYADGNMDTMAPMEAVEAAVGRESKVAQLFMGDDEPFPAARINAITTHGSVPLVTLQFNSLWTGGLDALNSGSRDYYIQTFADAAKANGNVIWLRPFHEMNGDWDAWSGTVGNNTPAKLVEAWKHVHDIFEARGATNVKFVWCPNDNSCPDTAANAIENYWPGDAYVDYTAVDLYNFGTSQTWSHWTPFANSFPGPYN